MNRPRRKQAIVRIKKQKKTVKKPKKTKPQSSHIPAGTEKKKIPTEESMGSFVSGPLWTSFNGLYMPTVIENADVHQIYQQMILANGFLKSIAPDPIKKEVPKEKTKENSEPQRHTDRFTDFLKDE